MSKLIILFMLIASGIFAQTKFCQQEICVVEFNAGWNESNSVKWLDDLVNCGVTRILITDKEMLSDIQERYNIQNVPTIIVFNGKEIKRFQACLRFKMGATREEVQEFVDNQLKQ